MKQNNRFNGDLMSEYKKTTNKIRIGLTTDIDSQVQTFWNRLRMLEWIFNPLYTE